MLAYLAVFVGVIGHASSEFIAVYSGVTGAEVSSWRYVIGASGILLYALSRPATRNLLEPLRKNPSRIFLLSLLGITAPYLAFHVALDYASVIQVATLVTTAPMWVAIANLCINRQSIGLPKLVAGICAFCGVIALLTDGYIAKLGGADLSILGLILVLGSSCAISVYTVLARPLVQQYGAIRITTITMTIGAAALWLIVGLAWNIWVDPSTIFERSSHEAWSLLTIGIWNTTITMILWLWGLSVAKDMTRASYLFFLKPVIAAMLALTILSQPITAFQIFAIIVVCSSVILELLWPKVTDKMSSTKAE